MRREVEVHGTQKPVAGRASLIGRYCARSLVSPCRLKVLLQRRNVFTSDAAARACVDAVGALDQAAFHTANANRVRQTTNRAGCELLLFLPRHALTWL